MGGTECQEFIRLKTARITLPAQNGPGDCVGIKLRYPVRGDFEIDATMELIDVDRPKKPIGIKGWSAGVNVYCYLNSKNRDGFWLGKMMDYERGMVICTGQRVNDGKDRNTTYYQFEPSPHEKGVVRVRLIRKGATFSTFYADSEAGELPEWHVREVSDADATIVRLAADPAWVADIAIDVRLIDFAITAKEIVGYAP